MEFAIRNAVLEDFDRLSSLFDELDGLHRDALPQIYRKPDGLPRSLEHIQGILSNDDALFLVAERDGNLIGLTIAQLHEAPDIPIRIPVRYAEVDSLIVSQRFRRSGVGRALLKDVEKWAKGKGAAYVQLHVWDFNQQATDFYGSHGYTTAVRRLWKRLT